ncbi:MULTISPECIES: hypothetical protein [unclassified Pseudomonas]|uniref:hypothetical protein n=1 Tax=unclassified Pseudomonas TaxID=196821 RepID=UPI00384F6BB8
MPASRPPFAFSAAAFADAEARVCMQAAFITRYPPPSPVSSPVVCVVAPPAVVVLG